MPKTTGQSEPSAAVIAEVIEDETDGPGTDDGQSKALTYTPAGGMDVERLMALAIEKEGTVDVLERLVALRNTEMERQAREAFFDALARFHRVVPPIPRTKRGASFVDKAGVEHVTWYAPLDGIQKIANPILHPLGLFYSWSNEATEKAVTTHCTLRHVLGHSETSSMALPVSGPPKSSVTQASSGTRSFGKRITLSDVLGISTCDEHDGAGSDDAGETVSFEQLTNLEGLYDEVKLRVDFPKFCAFFGITKLSEMPAAKYGQAIDMLERKRV